VVDHDIAADLALRHLVQLGHRCMAFIKGQAFSSDTELRWDAIVRCAQRLGLAISPKLVCQLEGDTTTPDLGYKVTRKLLREKEPFTALFAFNDISAIGAIRALREAGLQVPEDVSVVGFDDIQSAGFQIPPLTTVRQPLRRMGEVAADTLLRRISSPEPDAPPKILKVEPGLVVRDSTGPASALPARPNLEPHPKRGGNGRAVAARMNPPRPDVVEMVMRETGLSHDMSSRVVSAVGRYLFGEPS